ncbi:MAG: hypothetical protein GY850_20160 [bacterium]|nr:hypothetical protein [bacterium]
MKIAAGAIRALIFITIYFLLTSPSPALAFYEWQAGDMSIDFTGLVRGFGTAVDNPEDDFFYEDKTDAGIGAFTRLILHGDAGARFSFEINAYQTFIPTSLQSQQAAQGTLLDVERSGVPERSFSNDDYIHLAIDQLNVRGSFNRMDLVLGRQPINLATTFYFSPNDFFAPFAAQAFYRVYKPGVDAVRAEVRLGDLSQLSLISVFGYERDSNRDTGWSDRPDSNRASYIGRISTVFYDVEWALLGGVVRDNRIIGGSLQGEFFKWLGVRAEGHIAHPDDSQIDSHSEISIGVEHRWSNSLEIRLEQFYHGSGSGSVSDYLANAVQHENYYLGRNYTALGASYEFTPLLTAAMVAIANLTDHSYLISCNAIYSLADEAELAVNIGVPIGDNPKGPMIKSEFGSSPYSAQIEVRFYF